MNPSNPIPLTQAPVGGGRFISPFKKSDVLKRSRHNQIVSKLNPLLNITVTWGDRDEVVYAQGNVNIQLDRSKQGTGASALGNVKRLSITAINANTLTCSDGVTSYTVAKPELLRESLTSRSIDGVTVSYGTFSTANQTRVASATIGGNAVSQTEVISPRYKTGDYIIAANVTDSGVTSAPWIDLNADARAYSRKFTG